MNTVAAETAAKSAAGEVPAGLDQENFRAVVEACSGRLFALAYRMTGQRQDAEDLVQECFLRAYRSRGRYQARASVGTWLYRICTNAALDHLRKRRTHPPVHTTDQDADNPVDAVVNPTASPERLAMASELNQRLRAAIALLSPRERVAFALRHYEGWSIEEISAAMGMRPEAVKNTIFRGVRKLRVALDGHREAR
ncbi:MAG: RNA polymerase sigma factor [Terriglobales bacterium]